jgi:hypothetical protein
VENFVEKTASISATPHDSAPLQLAPKNQAKKERIGRMEIFGSQV